MISTFAYLFQHKIKPSSTLSLGEQACKDREVRTIDVVSKHEGFEKDMVKISYVRPAR
jgi:hypothetical protein